MLHLKSIELSGFKSFAKKSVLEFTTPVSAIVGPNGSGKSNVAEAFRFVLGEQSIKSMRGKKGEDLIFNGAGGESRANRAFVKVVFDNSNRLFSVDFPEVTIERVVHRDGVNEYLINGSQVRLRDVLELLARAHIGASGHHIISQGEADKILNASTRERKSMIEDALGLKLYQYKRAESEKKLEKTFENIQQVESLRKEIAPHIRFLKKQTEKIEKAESVRLELETLGQEYLRREEDYLNKERDLIHTEKKPILARLKVLDEELGNARKILENFGKKNKKDFEVLDIEAEIASARAEKDRLMRELGKVEGSVEAQERMLRSEKDRITNAEEKTVRLRDVEELQSDIEDEIKSAEGDSNNLIKVLYRVLDKISSFIKSKKVDTNSPGVKEVERALSELGKEKEKLEKELKRSDEREKSLREKYENLKKEIEKDKDTSHDAEKKVFTIMSEENELRSREESLRIREEQYKHLFENFKRDLEEISKIAGPSILGFRSVSVTHEDRSKQEDRRHDVERLKIRLEESGVSGAGDIMKEFKEVSERDEFLSRELLDLEKSAESLKTLIKELEERLNEEFKSGLEKINKEFNTLFTMMFGGGEAHLTLTKEKKRRIGDLEIEEGIDQEVGEEVIEEGLDIAVNLPRKKIRGLAMLSGGERALTSIALLFAITEVNPPPFIILDETDAALDEANSKKYGDIAERLSKRSQLILITHNRETMSRAGVIYGVTMSGTGVSKLLSIAFDQAVEVAK
ncbi:AAA family ATPase [Candidatus Parcubacteria bacterium]|nr:AAA family ATPase [Candidatus Parcubacteria bacterium]